MKCQYELDNFRTKLGKMPDLEKLIAKLYTYSVQHKVKAVYFENVSATKLKEFKAALTHLKTVKDILGAL